MHPKGTPAPASSVEARVFEERVDLSNNMTCRQMIGVGVRNVVLARGRRAPAALAAAPAGGRYGRRRPLHPRLPSRAPSRRARPTLLVHGTRRHTAAENRRCCARSARDLVLLRLDPAIRIPRVYTFENPQRPTLLVTLSISRLANTKSCDRERPICFLFPFFGSCGHPSVQNSRGFVPPEAERIRARRPELDGTTRLTETRGTGHGLSLIHI